MEGLLLSLSRAIDENNSYAALCLALSLPDIAAGIEFPLLSGRGHVKERYTAWYDKYLTQHYVKGIGPNNTIHVFMTAGDFYALRCAILHEGKDDISHYTNAILSKFELVTTVGNGIIHNNYSYKDDERLLNIQVEVICRQILDAVKGWWETLNNAARDNENAKLINIVSF